VRCYLIVVSIFLSVIIEMLNICHIYIYICGHLCVFFWAISVQKLYPFLNKVVVILLLSSLNYLYIFDRTPLSNIAIFYPTLSLASSLC
jgi:hypothetical protein